MSSRTAIATGVSVSALVVAKAAALTKTLGAATPDAATFAWTRHTWRRLTAKWCHQFHRRHHTISGLDSLRAKGYCSCCGRKFLLERRIS